MTFPVTTTQRPENRRPWRSQLWHCSRFCWSASPAPTSGRMHPVSAAAFISLSCLRYRIPLYRTKTEGARNWRDWLLRRNALRQHLVVKYGGEAFVTGDAPEAYHSQITWTWVYKVLRIHLECKCTSRGAFVKNNLHAWSSCVSPVCYSLFDQQWTLRVFNNHFYGVNDANVSDIRHCVIHWFSSCTDFLNDRTHIASCTDFSVIG